MGTFKEGEFLNGTIQFKDGSTYQGSMENGCKTGKAIYKNKNGDVYDGYFKLDKFDGQGELKRADGSSYVGEFKNGEYDGRGKLIKFDKGKKKFEYEGGFMLGLFEGDGELVFEGNRGSTFKGKFQGGKKEGYG